MRPRRTRRRFLESAAAVGVSGMLVGCLGRLDEIDVGEVDGGGGEEALNESASDDVDDAGNESTDEFDEDDGEEEEVPEPPEHGVVAFVYHDGPMHDYTQAFPVHQEFDAPASTYPVTNWIGTGRGVADRLDIEHLREVADAGWEIGSHTVDHATLGEFEFLEDAAPGDTQIYPEQIRHGHHDGKTVEITDGDRTVYRTLAGLGRDDDDVRYVELEEPLGEAFPATETVIRYPAEEMQYQVEASKRELESRGFQVDSLLVPYDHFGEYGMEFVTDHYDFVANGSLANPRINFADEFDPYRIRHRYFIEFTTPEAVQQDLDLIAETGAFGVFGAHAFKDEVYEEPIRDTLEWIEERGIEVLTVREAGRRYLAHQDD